MLQIEPRKYFPLTWNVPDPTDSNTYYVRAYIYIFNSAGERSTLEEVDLTDNGDQTFIYRYQMPADSSGQGRPVIVHYKAFTDSGYTTEQALYAQPPEEKYLIKKPSTSGGGFFGGSDINYKKIRKMLKKELKNIPKFPDIKETNLDPILESIVKNKVIVDLDPVLMAIKNIPEPERVNLEPVLDAIEQKETDLSGLFDGIRNLSKAIDKAKLDKAERNIEGMFNRIKKFFTDDINEIKKTANELIKRFDQISYLTLNSVPEKKEREEGPKVDLKNKRRGLL